MKRVFAFLLILVTLFGLAACTDKETDANSNLKYIYDDAGRVIKEERYTCDFDGEYILSRTFEYAYDENGNLKEKRLYDELTTERISQTHKYDYNSAGQRLREEIYNHEQELVCTTTYTYHNNGKIQSKKAYYTNLRMMSLSSTEAGGTVHHYRYSSGVEYDADEFTMMTAWSFDDEVENENATFTQVSEYYQSGILKTSLEYQNDVLIKKTEYPDYPDLAALKEYELETGDVWLCLEKEGSRELFYHVNKDGTYDNTLGAYVETTYYLSGNVSSITTRNDMDCIITETYYESGALKSRWEGVEHGWYVGFKTQSGEAWYESGALKRSWEVEYKPYVDENGPIGEYDVEHPYKYAYIEEFYENGAKKSLTEVDAEKGIDNYTQWDEEGNVIPAEE